MFIRHLGEKKTGAKTDSSSPRAAALKEILRPRWLQLGGRQRGKM